MTSIPRAVAAAGEIELLERVAEVLEGQRDRVDTPRIAIGAIVATGLTALASGRAAEAVESLREAAEGERRLGWPFRAACIDLDLALAFAAAGADADASSARERAAVVLAQLHCVNA